MRCTFLLWVHLIIYTFDNTKKIIACRVLKKQYLLLITKIKIIFAAYSKYKLLIDIYLNENRQTIKQTNIFNFITN